MFRFLKVPFALLLLVSATGCSTLADVEKAKGTGTAKVYNKPYDVVWQAVVETVKASGLTIESENKEKGTVLAHRSVTAWSWGENVGVFVEEAGVNAGTRVEVKNMRTLATNVTAKNWTQTLFASLDERLN